MPENGFLTGRVRDHVTIVRAFSGSRTYAEFSLSWIFSVICMDELAVATI